MIKSIRKQNDILYIVIPAFNEEKNILQVIKDWYPILEENDKNRKSRLIIFNDGSTDNTLALVKKAMKKRPLLKVINKKNSGHGSTILFAYQYAIENKADYIFQTDSDGQTRPEDFQKIWDLRNQYDLLIGYRKKREDGIFRIFVTKILKYVIRIIFKENICDANSPFRLMNKKSLQDCSKLIPKDFFLANVILSVVYTKKDYKVKYLPIKFRKRQGGNNSINLKKIIKVGIKALKDFRNFNNYLEEELKK